MRSKHVFMLHIAFDIIVVGASLLSAVVALLGTATISIVIASVLVAILMKVLWKTCGGCPLTLWESRLRVLEGQEPYIDEGCIADYLKPYFGPVTCRRISATISQVVFLTPAFFGTIKILLV